MIHIPKNYFHDKWVLLLIAVNASLLVLCVGNVIFYVDTDISSVSIVSYRASRAIQVSGPTSDLYQFAFFAAIVTIVSFMLSLRLYTLRRHLSLSVMGLNILSLSLSLVVFNALLRTL